MFNVAPVLREMTRACVSSDTSQVRGGSGGGHDAAVSLPRSFHLNIVMTVFYVIMGSE